MRAGPFPHRHLKFDSIFECHSHQLFLFAVIERQSTRDESVDDAADTPNVATERVGLLLEYLWCNVTKCTEGFCSSLFGSDDLRESKINNFRNR